MEDQHVMQIGRRSLELKMATWLPSSSLIFPTRKGYFDGDTRRHAPWRLDDISLPLPQGPNQYKFVHRRPDFLVAFDDRSYCEAYQKFQENWTMPCPTWKPPPPPFFFLFIEGPCVLVSNERPFYCRWIAAIPPDLALNPQYIAVHGLFNLLDWTTSSLPLLLATFKVPWW